jgi:hypothetical protein
MTKSACLPGAGAHRNVLANMGALLQGGSPWGSHSRQLPMHKEESDNSSNRRESLTDTMHKARPTDQVSMASKDGHADHHGNMGGGALRTYESSKAGKTQASAAPPFADSSRTSPRGRTTPWKLQTPFFTTSAQNTMTTNGDLPSPSLQRQQRKHGTFEIGMAVLDGAGPRDLPAGTMILGSQGLQAVRSAGAVAAVQQGGPDHGSSGTPPDSLETAAAWEAAHGAGAMQGHSGHCLVVPGGSSDGASSPVNGSLYSRRASTGVALRTFNSGSAQQHAAGHDDSSSNAGNSQVPQSPRANLGSSRRRMSALALTQGSSHKLVAESSGSIPSPRRGSQHWFAAPHRTQHTSSFAAHTAAVIANTGGRAHSMMQRIGVTSMRSTMSRVQVRLHIPSLCPAVVSCPYSKGGMDNRRPNDQQSLLLPCSSLRVMPCLWNLLTHPPWMLWRLIAGLCSC